MGESPLDLAVICGNTKIVEDLLKYKADPNFRTQDGRPVLVTACSEQFRIKLLLEPEMVIALLKNGANVNAVDSSGESALFEVCGYTNRLNSDRAGQITSILLASGANVDATNRDGITPLMGTASEAHPELVKQLLAAGANPNRVGKTGLTALDFALINQQANDYQSFIAKLSNLSPDDRADAMREYEQQSNNCRIVIGILRERQ